MLSSKIGSRFENLSSINPAKQAFSLNETVINEDDDIEAPWRPVTYDHK
jgi:hypothetical protein